VLSAMDAKLTDVSLPEKVGLTVGCVSTREFPINLVFNVLMAMKAVTTPPHRPVFTEG